MELNEEKKRREEKRKQVECFAFRFRSYLALGFGWFLGLLWFSLV